MKVKFIDDKSTLCMCKFDGLELEVAIDRFPKPLAAYDGVTYRLKRVEYDWQGPDNSEHPLTLFYRAFYEVIVL